MALQIENIFSIPVDVQVAILAGFVGHFIVSVGKQKYGDFERVISIFIYGTLGSLFFLIISEMLGDLSVFKRKLENNYVLFYFLSALIGSILSAAVWLRHGRALTSRIARFFGLYQDDHEPSAFDSFTRDICSSGINFVDIYTTDGWIIRSDYDVVVNKEGISSDRWIAFNHDGVSMYVTHSRDPSKKRATNYSAENSMLTYIPMNEIRRMRVF